MSLQLLFSLFIRLRVPSSSLRTRLWVTHFPLFDWGRFFWYEQVLPHLRRCHRSGGHEGDELERIAQDAHHGEPREGWEDAHAVGHYSLAPLCCRDSLLLSSF